MLAPYAENGNDDYLWVDDEGKWRISPSGQVPNKRAGTIVGAAL